MSRRMCCRVYLCRGIFCGAYKTINFYCW